MSDNYPWYEFPEDASTWAVCLKEYKNVLEKITALQAKIQRYEKALKQYAEANELKGYLHPADLAREALESDVGDG